MALISSLSLSITVMKSWKQEMVEENKILMPSQLQTEYTLSTVKSYVYCFY